MPELRQFRDLVIADFERNPVWIGCHTVDYDEPWYGETDEETFRPWTGELPVGPEEGMLLVRATFICHDGDQHQGFVTPSHGPEDLGMQQPQMFVGGRRFAFWGGVVGVRPEDRTAFYAALAKSPDATFPLRFSADPSLATANASGVLRGFYKRDLSGRIVTVEA